jgi:hypothetical protein
VSDAAELRRIRGWLGFFVSALVLSGLTAFPLETETRLLAAVIRLTGASTQWPALGAWVDRVHDGIVDTDARHPFVAYGTDWLAFAHLVIAVAFVGPLRDPVRNVWVVDFGRIACVAIVPFVLVCAPARGIPWFWQGVDISFGVLGLVPLSIARRAIHQIESSGGGNCRNGTYG